MTAQHFLFYTLSGAIIVLTVFVLVVLIYFLLLFKKINRSVNNVTKTVETMKEKIVRSSWISLLAEVIRELIGFLKNKKERKKEK